MPNPLQIAYPNADNPLAQAPSWADAAQSVGGTVSSGVDALGQWLAAQRAKSSQMGLWNDQTGLPTGKGLVSAAQQTGNALLMGTTAPGIRAFHGSPYDFERFDTSKIGTGEGAQAYGHGLYMAGNENVAQSYKMAGPAADAQVDAINLQLTQLSKQMDQYSAGQYGKYNDPKGYELKAQYDALMDKRAALGHMYEVNIGADPEQFLHWDQTVGQHPPAVRDKLLDMGYGDADRGADVYSHMARGKEGDAGASQRLLDAGIPGIRYLDQGSRGAGEGTRNTVVFDANTIDILRKYGLAGLGVGLSGAAAGTQGQPQQ